MVFFLVEICGLGVVVSPGCKAFAVLVVGITGVLVGTTVHLQKATMVSQSHVSSQIAAASGLQQPLFPLALQLRQLECNQVASFPIIKLG